jgi:hypothetical protein
VEGARRGWLMVATASVGTGGWKLVVLVEGEAGGEALARDSFPRVPGQLGLVLQDPENQGQQV